MISSTYNEDLQILEVIYKGKISYEDLVVFGENFSKNDKLPRKLKMITDVRKAEYTFPVEKVPLIAEGMEKHLKNYIQVKAAFLQSKPKETAISMVLEDENKTDTYIHKVFSTRESALKWLFEI